MSFHHRNSNNIVNTNTRAHATHPTEEQNAQDHWMKKLGYYTECLKQTLWNTQAIYLFQYFPIIDKEGIIYKYLRSIIFFY